MPFTVITLRKVPNALRGDLTRWMQEIATGVYVGNYNSRVREYLWKRVTDEVGNGEATMCFSCRNEIGYSFQTYHTERQVVDYDGIPLVLIPDNNSETEQDENRTGFSRASKYHRARRIICSRHTSSENEPASNNNIQADLTVTKSGIETGLVFLDIETTGLDADKDQIIEIGAVKVLDGKEFEFHKLICSNVPIPAAVRRLTGISDNTLKGGIKLENGIRSLAEFIRGSVLIGYNIAFDLKFVNREFEKFSLGIIQNRTIDLLHEAKRKNSFQINYKFETTLKEYGIDQAVVHRALEDAKLTYQLFNQMQLKV